MTFKKISMFCLFLGYAFISVAQNTATEKENTLNTETFIPQALTTSEFQNFKLPPLQTLFENAKANPRLGAIQAAMEAAQYELKLRKRDWFNYFSVHAGYNYGILGTYVDQETEYNPLTTVYSGASQHSYQVGANINIPLDHLINHRLTVKRQKKQIENVEYTQKVAFNEIKKEIIGLYTNIQLQLKILKITIETLSLYQINYEVSKNSFINNKSIPQDLTTLKNSHQKAQIEYENIIANLNIMLLELELLTNTKLISK